MLLGVRKLGALAFAVATTSCAMLPVRSSTGVRIKRVTIVESIALEAQQPRPVELSGAELAPAVELMDRRGVLSLRERAFDGGLLDGSSVSLVIEPADGAPFAIELDNFREPHVCGFLRDAVATRLIERLPQTCVE